MMEAVDDGNDDANVDGGSRATTADGSSVDGDDTVVIVIKTMAAAAALPAVTMYLCLLCQSQLLTKTPVLAGWDMKHQPVHRRLD